MNKTTKYLRNTLTIAVFILAISAIQISAATFTVSNTNDTGAGSLRQAILDSAAAGDDIINFDASFNVPRTITVASLMTITGNGALTLNGPGAGLLTLDGNYATRILEVSNIPGTLGAVIFNNLTIVRGSGVGFGGGVGINNSAPGTQNLVVVTFNNVNFRNNIGGSSGTPGGAIGCNNRATVNINNSIFTGNSDTLSISLCSLNITNSEFFENNRTVQGAGVISCGSAVSIDGSAIYNNGSESSNFLLRFGGDSAPPVTITNTTIANNTSSIGIVRFEGSNGPKTLRNVTIAGNIAASQHPNSSGGLSATGINNLIVDNSIIANNFSLLGASDIRVDIAGGGIISQGYNLFENIGSTVITGTTTGNLIGVDPWLDGTPRFNGGTTRTLALRQGSLAIDAGSPTTFPATDQRGITRPQDGDGNGNSRSDIGAFERRLIDFVPTDKADFDGDGKTDLSIFRPAPSEWWYQKSSNGGNAAAQFGASGDKIVPGDYTGDGKSDFAIFRPSNGSWFVLRSNDFSFFAFPFGLGTDTPVPADYDGDGKTDAAVFRSSSLTWFINKSTGGTDIIGFGAAGDKPVVGDYDGDGKADIAIYRNNAGVSEWWIRRSSNASVFALQFGISTDKPVQGDYTGDGKTDIAIFRPSNGNWFVLRSEDFSFYSFPFGTSTDVPTPGDYDGDGRTDAAVFRPSNSTWFVQRSTAGTLIQGFGITGDLPIPNAFVP